jgi:hypothetical protein
MALTVLMTSLNSAESANPAMVLIFSATLTSVFTLEVFNVKKGCNSAARTEAGNRRKADSKSPDTKVLMVRIIVGGEKYGKVKPKFILS